MSYFETSWNWRPTWWSPNCLLSKIRVRQFFITKMSTSSISAFSLKPEKYLNFKILWKVTSLTSICLKMTIFRILVKNAHWIKSIGKHLRGLLKTPLLTMVKLQHAQVAIPEVLEAEVRCKFILIWWMIKRSKMLGKDSDKIAKMSKWWL